MVERQVKTLDIVLELYHAAKLGIHVRDSLLVLTHVAFRNEVALATNIGAAWILVDELVVAPCPAFEFLDFQDEIVAGGGQQHLVEVHFGAVGEGFIQLQCHAYPFTASGIRNHRDLAFQDPFDEESGIKVQLVLLGAERKKHRVFQDPPIGEHITLEGRFAAILTDFQCAEEALSVLLPFRKRKATYANPAKMRIKTTVFMIVDD